MTARMLMQKHNLPQVTPFFIGRSHEISEITQLLDNPACRLLTLVGLGGIGKTQLAVAIGHQTLNDYPDGVFRVQLQPIQSSNLIAPAIVEALGIQSHHDPARLLLNYLAEQKTLLILDNFEQVLDGVELIQEILAAAPQVQVLITSRESLNLREEWVREVSGLPYPKSADTLPSHEYDATRLFINHAQKIRGDLQIEDQAHHIVRICQLVEGMPLAIELAASWVKTLSCEQIATEIQNNISQLQSRERNMPSRHASMEAVFAHSWQTLTPDQQTTLQRMSIFRGGCTLEAAQAVAGASLTMLATLVEKSWLRHDPETGRYDLHELVRQYAERLLNFSSGYDDVKYDHSVYFAEFTQSCVPQIKSEREKEALSAIDADFDNIRAAWEYAASLDLINILAKFIDGISLFGRAYETVALFKPLISHYSERQGEDKEIIAHRMLARVHLPHNTMDGIPFEKALAVAQKYSDPAEVAFCEYCVGSFLQARSDDKRKAIPYLDRSLEYYQTVHDDYFSGVVVTTLVLLYGYLGDWDSFKKYQDLLRGLAASKITNVHRQNISVGRWKAFLDGDYAEFERITLTFGKPSTEASYLGDAQFRASNSIIFLFRRGKFQETKQIATTALKDAQALLFGQAIEWAEIALGLVALTEGDFAEAWRILENNTLFYADAFRNCVLAVAAHQLGKYVELEKIVIESLKNAIAMKRIGLQAWCLPGSFSMLLYRTEAIRAAETLGLMCTHPASFTEWLENWPLLNRLRRQLEDELGSEVYAAAWERGTMLLT